MFFNEAVTASKSPNAKYEFYIDNVVYRFVNQDENYINDDIEEYIMEESNYFYVPSYKYRNGAFKGVIIKPNYPKYNIDIEDSEKGIKVCHIKDRIGVFTKNKNYEYSKRVLDVYGNNLDRSEYENCIILCDGKKYDEYDLDDMWLNDDSNEWVSLENGHKVIRKNYCGLYGFANYATVNDLWNNVGECYIVVASKDDITSKKCNLINPIIIYNPNNYEVKVDIMTFEE